MEHVPSEVSEAYTDVFEEDMPQPSADDYVSDAASVASFTMSVHRPSDAWGAPTEAQYIPLHTQGKQVCHV